MKSFTKKHTLKAQAQVTKLNVTTVYSQCLVSEEVKSCGSSSSNYGTCMTLEDHGMNDSLRCYAHCQNGTSLRIVKLVVLYRVDAKTAREGFS